MKRLALVLILLMFSSVVQAQDYEEVKSLYCKWSDDITEIFVLGGDYTFNGFKEEDWIVTEIKQYPAAIRVSLRAPNRKKYIDFNNGWPCRIERVHTFTYEEEPTNPESDTFEQVD